MTEPTQAVKTDFTYAVDQQVSVNAFIDIDINGENVRFQITSRFNSTAEKIVKTTKAAVEAYAALRTEYAKPAGSPAIVREAAPAGEKKAFVAKPVASNELPEGLPAGIECFKDDFDYFVIEPKPDNKASVKFFKDKLKFPVGAHINNWKHDAIKQALPFVDVDPSKAEEHRVSGAQYWKRGNEYINTKGEKANYKDFVMAVQTF